jgi:chitinase
MRQSSLLLLLLLCAFSVQAYDLSIFYCGFSGDFCGQSNFDDTNAKTSFVILAFVNTNSDGSITTDSANFPTDLVKAWQAAGRKVFISVGGQNGNWNYVFSSQDNIDTFVNSVKNTINLYKLDGVDLDIESYNAAPRTVANAIKQLK